MLTCIITSHTDITPPVLFWPPPNTNIINYYIEIGIWMEERLYYGVYIYGSIILDIY